MPSDGIPFILVTDEDIYNEYLLNLNIDRADNNELNAEEFDGQWNYNSEQVFV
jgi:hypothetical protein